MFWNAAFEDLGRSRQLLGTAFCPHLHLLCLCVSGTGARR